MSKTITKNKVVTIKDYEDDSDVDTDTFYVNILSQFKTVIQDQHKELDDRGHQIKIMEKALRIKNEDYKNKEKEFKDHQTKIKLLEQELKYYKDKEQGKNYKKQDTKKIIQELHDINTKRRDKYVSEAQLDHEAREFLKKFGQ